MSYRRGVIASAQTSGAGPPSPVVAAISAQSATTDNPYSYACSASGGTLPYTWSATDLPAGLSIAPLTGVISGSPTTAISAALVTITVTDNAGRTGSTSFDFTVTNSGTLTPYNPNGYSELAGFTGANLKFNDGFTGPNLDFTKWSPGYYYDGAISAGPFGAGNEIKGSQVQMVPGGVQLTITGSLGNAQCGVIHTLNGNGVNSGPWVANQPTGTTTSGAGNNNVGFTFSPSGGGTLGTSGPVYVEYAFTGSQGPEISSGVYGIADWCASWVVANPGQTATGTYIDEIDVVETGPQAYAHVHINDYVNPQPPEIAAVTLAPDVQHIVGCLWSTTSVTFFYDGDNVGTYDIPAPMQSLVSGIVLTQTDASGNGGGNIYPTSAVWRYVRVWQ